MFRRVVEGPHLPHHRCTCLRPVHIQGTHPAGPSQDAARAPGPLFSRFSVQQTQPALKTSETEKQYFLQEKLPPSNPSLDFVGPPDHLPKPQIFTTHTLDTRERHLSSRGAICRDARKGQCLFSCQIRTLQPQMKALGLIKLSDVQINPDGGLTSPSPPSLRGGMVQAVAPGWAQPGDPPWVTQPGRCDIPGMAGL